MFLTLLVVPFFINLFFAWCWAKNISVLPRNMDAGGRLVKYSPGNTRVQLLTLALGVAATAFGYLYGSLVVGASLVALANLALTPTVVFLVVMFGWTFTVIAVMIISVVMDLLSKFRNKVRSARTRTRS